MAGLVHLSRMIDKGRAFKQKSLAEYIYPCPLDKIILNFLNIKANKFALMTIKKKDEEICAWANELIKSKSSKELNSINEQILQRKPDSEDRLNYFNEIRNKIDPSRSDITTWVDLLDLEEGRLSSKPS